MSDEKLHIFLFPYMAMGHAIPLVDIAKLFAMKGAKTTLLITPTNVPFATRSIERTQKLGFDINVVPVKMPFKEVGLPEDSDNIINIPKSPENREKFRKALRMLDEPLERLIEQHRPDCLVADVFMPWANTVAPKIPKLMFHGSSYFASCLADLTLHWPHDKVSDDDSDTVLIPDFPGQVTMTREEVAIHMENETEKLRKLKEEVEAEVISYGVVMNSFYELETAYVDRHKNVLGRKSWAVGPVSACNKSIEDKLERVNRTGRTDGSVDAHHCLKWLDSKKPGSVVYVSFGSFVRFNARQLHEIASGLEASEQQFVWVVSQDESAQGEEWLPQGYEDRMKEKGLLIKGWAPQVLILDHEAVGSFVTHCGWNSTLEGITAGVSMVTWPMMAEQYANEKFVTQVLKIGIPVGRKYSWLPVVSVDDQVITSEMVEKAVKRVMVGKEAEEMRRKARRMSEMAKKAIEEGGSSNLAVTSLLEELKSLKGASKSNV